METILIEDAQRELSQLVDRARAGETIIIEGPAGARVKLEPLPDVAYQGERVPGRLKGIVAVPKGLLDPMTEDELKDWYGE